MRSGRLRCGFTLVELVVLLAILGVLLGLLLAAVQHARMAALRVRCLNNLRQIGLALHQYHGVFSSFPPGVSYQDGADPYPFMSWNTRLLPFLEQDNDWKEAQQAFAQSRNFLNNPPHQGLARVIPVYGCPTDPRTLEVAQVKGVLRVAFTSYLGVSGSNQFRGDGVLYLDSRVRFADITDGTSNTLCVGERPPSADGVLGWCYAGWGQNRDGSGDMVLSVAERNESIYAPGCPAGPYRYGPGRVQNQCDLFHYWSLHPGGAHFLFTDASVHFLPYSAAPVMAALATRSGGEPSPADSY